MASGAGVADGFLSSFSPTRREAVEMMLCGEGASAHRREDEISSVSKHMQTNAFAFLGPLLYTDLPIRLTQFIRVCSSLLETMGVPESISV